MYNSDKNEVPRSVTSADIAVVFIGLFHNLTSSVHAFAEDLMELATYNATRKTAINKIWKDFANDLEKMED
jgi:hypothetical protein